MCLAAEMGQATQEDQGAPEIPAAQQEPAALVQRPGMRLAAMGGALRQEQQQQEMGVPAEGPCRHLLPQEVVAWPH